MLYKKYIFCVLFFMFSAGTWADEPHCADGNVRLSADFSSRPVPQEIFEFMRGKSYPENTLVPLSDLRYVSVKHIGFDGREHEGHLIVHKEAACDVTEIFQELYQTKYPIEKIRLIDHYSADDHISMADNNSSAFCWRLTTDATRLSNHALGLAVDINPLQNPYVKNGIIDPVEGKAYVNRNQKAKGMITRGDAAVKAFESRGWTWGGNWTKYKDWQHFEKFSPLRAIYQKKLLGKDVPEPRH